MNRFVGVVWCSIVALIGMAGGTAQATAQQPGRVAVSDASKDPASRTLETLLARTVTLDVTRVSLSAALDAVAVQAGVPIQYGTKILRAYTALVSVHARGETLGRVLEQLLDGTTLRVVADGERRLALVDVKVAMVAGGIMGRVSDAKTGRALHGVSVVLDDSVAAVRTDDRGRYHFATVVEGSHRVTVRAVGYARQTHVVDVVEGKETTADFALTSSVNTLDQIVVTATGAQRMRELGHVVTQLNVDSLVKVAPITSVSELLTGRVPGLQVAPGNGGVVGGEVALRVRGQSTIYANPQPIVIVDGVRYKNTNTTDSEFGGLNEDQRPYGIEPRSPLNDLNINDIETIEVVKGPSASTLYGPDASNGVIVITTKRGQPGKTKWNVFAYPDLSVNPEPPATVTRAYRAWGHDPHTLEPVTYSCFLANQAGPDGCVLDSITVVPSLNSSSPYSVTAKSRPQWHSGANVSGGTPDLTYYVSGRFDSQNGVLQLSPFAAQLLKEQLGTETLGRAIRDPNTQQSLGTTASIGAKLGATGSLTLNVSYVRTDNHAINVQSVYQATNNTGIIPPGVDTTDPSQLQNFIPTDAFLQTSEQQSDRVTATATSSAQLLAWLRGSATVGMDLDNANDHGIEPVGAEGADFTGQVSDYRRKNTEHSASVLLAAQKAVGPMTFRTSIGSQYTYSNLDGLNATGQGLAPGSSSISTATILGSYQLWTETVDLGTFGEEVVGVNDRLFLTASLRVDGSTQFGDPYRPRPFPKFGIAWTVSDEPFLQGLKRAGVTSLHLRASFGASSQYPTSAEKYGYIESRQAILDGTPVNVFDRSLLANPEIRPEHNSELEYGADLTIASNVNLGVTWFTKRTRDALATSQRPYNYLSAWGNIGNIQGHGFEATLNIGVVRNDRMSLDVNAGYSYNTNKLVKLGDAPESKSITGSLVLGYPLDAIFGQTVESYADSSDGGYGGGPDGIIESNEVTLSPVRYLGVPFPPRTLTINPVLNVLGGHVQLSALFDRQSGGSQLDTYTYGCTTNGSCSAAFLKSTPLAEQAKFATGNPGDFIVSSNFMRWRELSLSTELPARAADRLWLSRAAVSFQVRNVMLWTNYKGPDPESIPGLGTVGFGSTQSWATGIPQQRSWGIRFDITPR